MFALIQSRVVMTRDFEFPMLQVSTANERRKDLETARRSLRVQNVPSYTAEMSLLSFRRRWDCAHATFWSSPGLSYRDRGRSRRAQLWNHVNVQRIIFLKQ